MKQQNDANRIKPAINPLSISTDLLAGVLVGLFSGFYLDKFLQLTPLFTIIGSILGVFASINMIYKRMK